MLSGKISRFALASRALPLLVAALLSGCAMPGSGADGTLPASARVSAELLAGDDDRAGPDVRKALQRRPLDPALHFANGWLYERAGRGGDQSVLDLARVGYETAARLDPTFWPARAALAWLAMERHNWDEAIIRFADALTLMPRRADLWLGLASAAYQGGALAVAQGAVNQALAIAPERADIQRAGVLIAAAAGHNDTARARFTAYQTLEPARATDVETRLSDWKDVHSVLAGMPDTPPDIERGPGMQLAASFPPDPNAGGNGGNDDPTNGDSYEADTSSGGRSHYGPPGLRPLRPARGRRGTSRMVLIDVVIVREQESSSTGRGVNLLDGLQIQLGGSLTVQSQTTATGGAPSISQFTRILAGAITIPTVTYSLNIANASGNRAEVLARPTLVALDGQSSRFFSGAEITVALPGQYGGDLDQIAIGVGLSVTPTFISDENVLLRVIAERDSISPNMAGTFSQAIQTARNTVTANISLSFGQTLVLSGLIDQETTQSRSGVPLLESIPGIQYLFAREDDTRNNRTLLITLTPRRAGDPATTGRAASKDQARALAALQGRVPPFQIAPNLDAISRKLEANGLLREFRTGDLTPEQGVLDRNGELLRRALEFLYF
jgi:Flp pilus assembly protein TadD